MISRRLFLSVPALVLPFVGVTANAAPRAPYVKAGDYVHEITAQWKTPNGGGRVFAVHSWVDNHGYMVDMDHRGSIYPIYDQYLPDFNNTDHIGADFWEERFNGFVTHRYPNPKWGGMREYVRIKRNIT
jgi:hypothetical protein